MSSVIVRDMQNYVYCIPAEKEARFHELNGQNIKFYKQLNAGVALEHCVTSRTMELHKEFSWYRYK